MKPLFKAAFISCLIFSSLSNVFLNKNKKIVQGSNIIDNINTESCIAKNFFLNSQNISSNSKNMFYETLTKVTKSNEDGLIFENFCDNQDDTSCCTDHDKTLLKQWWIEKMSYNSDSKYQTRKLNTKSALAYKQILLENADLFRSTSEAIMQNINSNEKCKQSAEDYIKLNDNHWNKMKDYKTKHEKCQKLTDTYQEDLICSACDKFKQYEVNFTNQKFSLDEKFCSKVFSECSEIMALNLEHVHPYLKSIENLAKCDMTDYTSQMVSQNDYSEIMKDQLQDVQTFTTKIYSRIKIS